LANSKSTNCSICSIQSTTRSRRRGFESIYVSVIFCIALAWLLFFGPRVLFHEGTLVTPPAKVTELNKKELPFLDLPKTLVHKVPPKPKFESDQDRVAQTAQPSPKPAEPVRGAPGTPQPVPQHQAQQPQQARQAPQPQQPQTQPQPQQPRPAQNTPLPDAPHPAPAQQAQNRPNFGTPSTPGQSLRDAANAVARGAGGSSGLSAPSPHGGVASGMEILSDTMGDDFGQYMKRFHTIVQTAWEPLIPEECNPPLNKDGTTIIRIKINRDGTIASMRLEDSTHDRAIDRAAWGSFLANGQFPPFPKNFKSDSIELRATFVITHGNGDQR